MEDSSSLTDDAGGLALFDRSTLFTCVVCLLAPFLLFYRLWLNKPVMCACRTRMTGKTVIITGATSGIGLETTTKLAHRGARIIMACRDVTLAKQLSQKIKQASDNPYVTVKHLDLSSVQSIRSFVSDITKSEKKVDVLINNAAVLYPPEKHTPEGHETTFMVNYLGPFLLTHLLLDLLLKSQPSRIINVSSHEHTLVTLPSVDDLFIKTNTPSYRTYCHSKLAQILHTLELCNRLEDTGVAAYAVHPGLVKSKLRRNISFLKLPLVRRLSGALQSFFFKSVEGGCQSVVYCAVSPELLKQKGLYYSNCAESTPSVDGINIDKAKKLWDLSEQHLKITPDLLPGDVDDSEDSEAGRWGWGAEANQADNESDIDFDGDEWMEEVAEILGD